MPRPAAGNIRAALLIVACLVAFFAEPIFTSKVFSPAALLFDYPPWNRYAPPGYTRPNTGLTDRVNQHDRWRQFNRESLRHAELPLWNPWAFAGVPHLANYQSAPLYPPSLAMLPFSFETAQLLIAMFHLGIAGLFTWLFLRRSGIEPPGAILGALSFMFSGAPVLWLSSPGGYVVVWLPALMYLTGRLIAAPCAGVWFGLYAVISLQFLAGHPESSYYILTMAWVFFAFRLVERWRSAGRSHGLHVLGAYAAASILGLLTAAAQIIPFLEYLPYASAAGGIGDWSRESLLPRPRLLSMSTLVFPYVFGHPAWGDREFTGPLGLPLFNEIAGVYVGILPLLLACWTAATELRRDRNVRFFVVFAAVALAYFYWLPPVYTVLKATPLLNASKTLVIPVLSNFCLAYLAGRGLNDWMRRAGDVAGLPFRRRTARLAIATALAIIIGVGLAQIGLARFRDRIIAFGEARVGALVRQQGALGERLGPWRAAAFWRARVPVTYENARWAAATPLITAAILLAAGALVMMADSSRGRARLVTGVIALTLGDLFFFGVRVNTSTVPEKVYPSTESIRFLQADPSIFRISGINQVLPPNVAMAYGLADARGLDALRPDRYARLLLADGKLANSNLANPSYYPHYNSRALDLANVKYVLADAPLPDARRLDLVFGGDILIYRNRDVLPRAWLVGAVSVAPSADAALRRLLSPGFDPRREAVVESPVHLAAPSPSSHVGGNVEVVHYEPRHVLLRVSSRAEALLVMSDDYYPGWRAFVDGAEQPIHLTDYAFRGVIAPPGEHRVEFVYDPRSFRIGAVISLGAMVLALSGTIVGGRIGRQR